ncbi:hypothetical protein LTR91_007096 [Friedmanniomyces endolithicus]|uniref:DNA/RNA-binding domain-containing protein n=1 Tax=Friedmanniomyces endolithicus TaxID=329885 RepID=A0A4U0UVY8_9PEZI|nr:hypothetical protein LTS09_007486 [Friedmanniomyces endolithicus]KAK0312907.1 hypothetical protein LTR01_002570 [Friedmanniomyces endolithicus]KAK0828978.1 hypothetical protein LTR73_004611 [Friedmanniomyces endolithicus]KAK0929837.1 hypothetical protein LTR57_001694 [Friedmanniomyces endolithicus]KAK0996123.1 hypothetical protein LTR91_007096 [Friedmanniomyces endolithicus]
MEESLAREQAAERHVYHVLKDKSQPLGTILQAFDDYRQICLTNIFADFAHAQEHQARLWQAHSDGKRYFHDALAGLRKQGHGKSVESRSLAKLFKGWIKDTTHFYQDVIRQLNTTFGGIPELEAVAHQVKGGEVGESSTSQLTSQERAAVLASCHQTLVYIGDMWRYRASEKLDNTPDFGPAIGYYGLANTLRPSSGLGYHQQAVVALEQRAHLRSIYHLYRAIVVDEPHPLAAKNLKLEFGKVNTAWEKGDLIPKTMPNDPDAAKQILVGWFVRLQSMCAKGEVFSSHAELEQEVVAQLGAVVRKEVSMSQTTLMRLVMVNLAAQYQAGVLFQEKQQADAQQAFFYFFRLNIKTYTILLQVFYDAVRGLTSDVAEDDDLAKKLTPTMRRLLPALRLYSSWLTCNLHLVAGLGADDFLGDSIDTLWATYARTVDVLADEDVFGVWALDEYEVAYMLEEDADTLGFKPLQDSNPVRKKWYAKEGGMLKSRFSDASVVRVSEDEEMMARMKGLLDDGSYLAHEAQGAPIGIVGDRIYHGKALQRALAAAEEAKNQPPKAPKVKAKPAPLSYAAAAKSGRTVGGAPAKASNGVLAAPVAIPTTHQVQATRMVDSLVEEDDGNVPVTPPQQHVVHPAILTNGDTSFNDNGSAYAANHHADMAAIPSYQPKLPSAASKQAPPAPLAPGRNPPILYNPKTSLTGNFHERFQSVSKLWDNEPASHIDSSFPSGLPTGTFASPPSIKHYSVNHSRVNSANSIRSRASQGMEIGVIGNSWSSIETPPQALNGGPRPAVLGRAVFRGSSEAESPSLLFGASAGIWSVGKRRSGDGWYGSSSPPEGSGQAG